MTKLLQDITKKQIALLATSVALIIIGIVLLLGAIGVLELPGFKDIGNILIKYIFVILATASGIMTFSNVATTLQNKKLRNGLTIAITTFSTILTVPLVYVFIAIFGAQNGNIDAFGEIMGIQGIVEGFNAWFGNGAFIYAVYTFMLVLSVVFISVPLASGILAVKGKTIIIGKKPNGKFGIRTQALAVLQNKNN